MSTYTIVRSNRLNAFGNCICGAPVVEMFDFSSVINRIEVEMCLKTHFKIPERLFNKSLADIKTDSIIVFDGHARKEFLSWLADHNPGKRLIFWCWNSVNEIDKNLKLKDIPHSYECWSYSDNDCKKYGLKKNTTFYWNEASEMHEQETVFDLYFIGKDKGRYRKIKQLESKLSLYGIKCLFQITPTHVLKLKKGLSDRIPYREVLENISKSKGILDMVVTSTAGPSLRPIEAALYRKKLVTDNEEVKKMKFYCAQNVFVIGGGV